MEIKLESFHWGKHFETGIENIDTQHHALVDLINRFGELLTQPDSVAHADIETVLATQMTFQQVRSLISLGSGVVWTE